MIDHLLTRNGAVCPLCQGPKDKGLVTCWGCYRRHDLRNGNAKAAAIIDDYEATQRTAALTLAVALKGADEAARLRAIIKRHVWLLSELHGGNEFSKDDLWRWLTEAQSVLHSQA
jgi:hypothetical protein